jgi:quercetin dioxygenase-like cupin family protein
MLHFNYKDTEAEDVSENATGTRMRWLISKKDGSINFAMRLFDIEPKGEIYLHKHKHEHEIFVLEGKGKISGSDEEFGTGDVIFIPGGEKHGFKNIGEGTLRFLCMIPAAASI